MITSKMFGRSPAPAVRRLSLELRLQPGAPSTVSPAAPAPPARSRSRRVMPRNSSMRRKLIHAGEASGRGRRLAAHHQLVGPQSLATLEPPVEDGHVHLKPLELQRRPGHRCARAPAGKVLAGEPQLETGAPLPPLPVVDGRDAGLLHAQELPFPHEPGHDELLAMAECPARAAGQRQQGVALVHQHGQAAHGVELVPGRRHARLGQGAQAIHLRPPDLTAHAAEASRQDTQVGLLGDRLQRQREAPCQLGANALSLALQRGTLGQRRRLAPLEQDAGSGPRASVEPAVAVEEGDRERRGAHRPSRRGGGSYSLALPSTSKSGGRRGGPDTPTAMRRPSRSMASLRTRLLVGGTRKISPTTSVTKPGVIRRAAPRITSTPSTTSRWGILPAAMASLKRRQTARPWDRSSRDPSTESAARIRIVHTTPMASPTLRITYSSTSGM